MSVPNPEPPVQRGMVDTHCHLFLIEEEPSLVVETARSAGVDRVICVGIDAETSSRSLELADSIAGVFATAGVHPHEASLLDARTGSRIEELLHDPRVVGVGECGLDFYRMRSSVEDQLRALRLHIALSNESGKPLVVHCREAWPDVLRLLDEGSAERVVLHCFSGDAGVARECASRGYWLSFAGNVTYPKNAHLREAATVVDISRLLVETDAPFLAPQRRRGRDNAPANVADAIEAIAEARDVDVETIARATSANAETAFHGLR